MKKNYYFKCLSLITFLSMLLIIASCKKDKPNQGLAAPVINYVPAMVIYTDGATITPLVPTSSGGAVSGYAINTPLPAGLLFDTNTGIISGTPTALSSATTYKVIATNATGTVTTTIVLTVNPAAPAQLGLYETDTLIYKDLIVAVSKIGTTTVDYGLIFDTGSGGMVIDAEGILPSSMITSSGFNFSGDSTVVNGITITNQTSMIEYGADAATVVKVYGNLAYASITIGDQGENIVVKRLPFFLYYKGVDAGGNVVQPHDFDVFGVNEEYDVSFANKAYITSPFSYVIPGAGLINGFKMAALGTSNFSHDGNYAPGVVSLGLSPTDVSSSSGFTMSQLTFSSGYGYFPYIPANITYSGRSAFASYVLFDTGTEPYTYIEDPAFNAGATLLPVNSSVTVNTTSGFNLSYTTTATENLTYVENPTTSGGNISIISLEYFLNNEYMLNFQNHILGLKNN
jgi:hypothetical protein